MVLLAGEIAYRKDLFRLWSLLRPMQPLEGFPVNPDAHNRRSTAIVTCWISRRCRDAKTMFLGAQSRSFVCILDCTRLRVNRIDNPLSVCPLLRRLAKLTAPIFTSHFGAPLIGGYSQCTRRTVHRTRHQHSLRPVCASRGITGWSLRIRTLTSSMPLTSGWLHRRTAGGPTTCGGGCGGAPWMVSRSVSTSWLTVWLRRLRLPTSAPFVRVHVGAYGACSSWR
jgi:hypothetical protein